MLRNIFKRKKPEKKPAKKPEVKPKPKPQVKPKPAPKPKKVSGIAPRVLREPHVTEKATDLAKGNRYVFKVLGRANKVEVRKAIEDLYGVEVVSVKIINVPRKSRKLGRIEGWRKGYKKAVVKVRKGQKIEILPT